MTLCRLWCIVCLAGAVVAGGCADVSAPAEGDAGPAAERTATAAVPNANTFPAAEPQTVADIFPPGDARDGVLTTCGACHNVACSAIGRRPAERWAALREAHRERITSQADLEAMFSYLQTHFNDTKPEPKVPPRFLEGGCTPF